MCTGEVRSPVFFVAHAVRPVAIALLLHFLYDQTGKRVAAEAAATMANADKQALRRRVESAEGCIQEMDTERHV